MDVLCVLFAELVNSSYYLPPPTIPLLFLFLLFIFLFLCPIFSSSPIGERRGAGEASLFQILEMPLTFLP